MDEATRADLLRLDRELEHLLGTDPAFLAALRASPEARILDLACGACDEAETLTALLSRLRGERPDGAPSQIHLTGMDIREREIAWAADRFRDRPDQGTGYEFLVGNASRLDVHRQLPEAFQVVFLRHQNLWNGALAWEEIYHHALEKLAPGGRVVITSYFDREHAQALEAFRRQGGHVLVSRRPPGSRKLPTPGKSVDRHIAVLTRPE